MGAITGDACRSISVCVGCGGAVAGSSRGIRRRHGRSNVELSALYSMDAFMKRASCVPIATRMRTSIASTARAHAASPIRRYARQRLSSALDERGSNGPSVAPYRSKAQKHVSTARSVSCPPLSRCSSPSSVSELASSTDHS